MPKWKRSTYVALSILDLLRIYVIRLRWARWRSEVVICDRYLWDSHVDLAVNFPETMFSNWLLWRTLERLAPAPDVAFLLLVAGELTEQRVREEAAVDWRRQDHAGRFARYKEMSRQGHWTILDGELPIEDLANQVMRALAGKLHPNQ